MKFPNEEGINFITNLSYINSDITPLPLIPFLFNKNALWMILTYFWNL